MRPLEGVRIISFTQFLLGPAAVQYLSDLGADVIKVEGPQGAWERGWAGGDCFLNGVSVFFLLANRNSRSIVLDLKQREGVSAAKRLIASADVVVENFRPGVMQRLGLDYESLQAEYPTLVYASASGYGASGEFAKSPGQDLLLQAMTGLAANTGSRKQAPVPAGATVVDQHGATLLAMGVLAALLHRAATGTGQLVEVNMVQAALDLQMEPLVYYLNGGKVCLPEERVGSSFHPAPYGLYETTDGHIAISLCPVSLLRRALDDDQSLAPFEDPTLAFTERDAIRRAVEPLIIRLSTTEALEQLNAGGVWCARVNNYEDALAEPAIQHLDPVVEVTHPDAGRLLLLRHPISYSNADTSVRSTAPRLGEHSTEILTEIGFSDEDVQELRGLGVLG